MVQAAGSPIMNLNLASGAMEGRVLLLSSYGTSACLRRMSPPLRQPIQ